MEWILNRGQNRSGRREAVEGRLGEWQGEGETSLSGSSPELPCVSPKDVEGRRTGTRVRPWRKRPKEVVSEEVDKSLPWSLNRGSNWTLWRSPFSQQQLEFPILLNAGSMSITNCFSGEKAMGMPQFFFPL